MRRRQRVLVNAGRSARKRCLWCCDGMHLQSVGSRHRIALSLCFGLGSGGRRSWPSMEQRGDRPRSTNWKSARFCASSSWLARCQATAGSPSCRSEPCIGGPNLPVGDYDRSGIVRAERPTVGGSWRTVVLGLATGDDITRGASVRSWPSKSDHTRRRMAAASSTSSSAGSHATPSMTSNSGAIRTHLVVRISRSVSLRDQRRKRSRTPARHDRASPRSRT
jgi:hypothetical protein